MKTFIPAITLVSLLSLQTPAEASWTSKGRVQEQKHAEATANTPGFNLKDDRFMYIEADYLLWRPQMEDSYFAIKAASAGDGGGSGNGQGITARGKLKQPNFNLSSGVRLGIGSFNTDSWDFGLKGTYLYSDASKHLSGNPSNNTVVIPDWLGVIFGFRGTKTVSYWKMNFGLVDFTIGREFFLTKRFVAHPFIGLRGAIINQTNHVKYRALFELATSSTTTTEVPGTTKFNAKSDIWGLGPRAGFDLNFYLSNEWSLLGGLAGSLLYTKYKIKEKFNGLTVESSTTPNVDILQPFDIKMKDGTNFGRANLDAYFGLGWDRWYNHGKNRVSIAVAFEAQQWFSLNQWFSLDVTTSGGNNNNNGPFNIRADKRHGDLSLIGGTLHFQLDF